MNQRLVHDVALALAQTCLKVCDSEIDPKRYKEVFDEFYAIAKVAIEEYELRACRILHRLRPLFN
jgi:hypothetical protein